MFNATLSTALQEFAALMLPLSENDLERPWVWKDHDEEGIRFAFFVTLQELRDLAVHLASAQPVQTAARHILSQYHAAFLDLQAAILGLSNEEAERPPAEGEWPVQKVYAHILSADINFTITVRYALEGHRAGAWTSERASDLDADRLAGIHDDEYMALVKGPLNGMVGFHREFHNTVIEEFATIQDRELDLPATFWEETRFPVRHRLHRYEAHFAQHTVQIDKTLVAIGQAPGESKQLLRKIYAALAEVEGWLIGAEKMDETAILATASSISKRIEEIKSLVES